MISSHHLVILFSTGSIVLFVILVTLTVFSLLFIASRLFRSGGLGNAPSSEKVQAALANLTPADKDHIQQIHTRFSSALPLEAFSTLCVAAALTIGEPISKLSESIIFSDYVDSLKMLEFVMLLEDLYDIQIPDEDAEKLRSLQEVVTYVGARTAGKQMDATPRI